MSIIKKAVIIAMTPCDSLLPVTKALAAEMIPILDIPVIQLVVEEVLSSEIEEILILTTKGNEVLENHFNNNAGLNIFLAEKRKVIV